MRCHLVMSSSDLFAFSFTFVFTFAQTIHCFQLATFTVFLQDGEGPYRDEFIRYRIAVCDAKSKFCDAKSKFCDAKLNVIRRKLRCKAILTAQK